MELFKSLTHPSELRALVQYKFLGGQNAVMPKLDYVRARTASKSIAYVTVPLSAYQDAFCFCRLQDGLSSGMKRCYQLLNATSRSFAAVIQALDDDLRQVGVKAPPPYLRDAILATRSLNTNHICVLACQYV